MLFKRHADGFCVRRARAAPIHTYDTAVRHGFLKVLEHCGHARLAHFKKLYAVARHLLLGLQKVASVRPQSGLLLRYHEGTRRAGKVRKVAPRLEMRAHMLGRMKIRCGHDVGMHAMLRHARAQRRDFFR